MKATESITIEKGWSYNVPIFTANEDGLLQYPNGGVIQFMRMVPKEDKHTIIGKVGYKPETLLAVVAKYMEEIGVDPLQTENSQLVIKCCNEAISYLVKEG